MYSTVDFRKGLRVELLGKVYNIVDFQHVKPGKGGAFVRTKLKNLETGQLLEQTFRSGTKVAKPDLLEKKVQYIYFERDKYVFMDLKTYEQVFVDERFFDKKITAYLSPEIETKLLYFNSKPIGLELPANVILKVSQTEIGVKGDTATGATKNAILETGLSVEVPLFINENDKVRVDTRTGKYMERV